MSWFLIVIAAQVILGTSAVFDKLLLKRRFFKPFVYTFWIGVLGALVFFLIPFGFEFVSLNIVILGFITGVIFILAMFTMFLALHKTEASKSLLIIGAFSPIATLIISYFFLSDIIGVIDFIGFLFLIFGGFILFSIEQKAIRFPILSLTIASSILFGFSNVLTKIVFENSSFITGFTLIKLGGLFFVLLMLIIPSIRKKVFSSSKESNSSNRYLYFGNRIYAGLGSILFYIAISLTHPALVDSTNGLKYATIFFASWFLLKEHFKGKVIIVKIIATIFIFIGLIWLGLGSYFNNLKLDSDRDIVWGVTFSKKASNNFGLDWKKNYEEILSDLNPEIIRIPAYWDEIERENNNYNFDDLDWQINKSSQYNINVVLVVGMKVPRWPECHIPNWAKELETEKREDELRNYIKEIIKRYKNNSAISVWQVENEPYLAFGDCPERGEDFLQKEIAIIKSLDNNRPILITDGGEFGLWYKAAREGDIFGTTMYRKVYSPKIGEFEYPITPGYFRLKDKIIHFIIGDKNKKFIVAELQGEPWTKIDFSKLSVEKQFENFGPEYFRDTIEYAKKTGFNEYYLWGVEWWYWLKEKENTPIIWNEAKILFAR